MIYEIVKTLFSKYHLSPALESWRGPFEKRPLLHQPGACLCVACLPSERDRQARRRIRLKL
ncbi:MAG: hypothetical protein DRH37_03480 [Deltaproteobacteria bacterium]|nr:MAG: hypothetical protein B5M55_03565 [Desulfococcus sp. 4484_242]RLC31242.1 MAG: hypothetical protein DRH37_03480 [Deltaproteobacteria bacterium]